MTNPSLVRDSEPFSRRRIRVLTLVDGIGTYGGGESLAREIALRLDPARFEITYCVSRWDPELAGGDAAADGAVEELKAVGARFIGLDRSGRPALRPWGTLISDLRATDYDVLHSHKFGSNVWGAVFSKLGHVPVFVAHEHTWSFEGRPMRKFIDRNLIGRAASVVVAVSNADRERMIRLEGLDPDKVVMIPNGIPDPRIEPGAGAAVRAELGLAPDQPVIGTVATIRPQKALNLLVEATALLARDRPEVRVLVVGGDVGRDPTLRTELSRQAERLGIAENVLFLGLRADVPAVIDALDVAVCCSDFEGCPLSVMEYMEGRCPVVATRVGGLPDLIGDGRQGLVVEPRDPGGLAGAIDQLLADPQRAKLMGQSGQDRRRSEFSIEATVRRVEDLYERSLVSARADGRG